MTKLINRKGFTLVELLIVVLILAALAAVAIPRITASAETAKKNACDTNVDLINAQIEMYRANNSAAPATLATVTGDTAYFPDGPPVCPYGIAYVLGANGHVTPHNH
ncbi:MAG: prepilin-type N-terminal cleavage/methylation domain-containing protein [Planctomycetota bacterium]